MPFHPQPDSGPDKPAGPDFGLLAIRLIAASAFFYYQLAGQLGSLLRFVWQREEWTLVEQLADFDLPFPRLLAPAVILLLAIALLGAALGIFTRINALVLSLLTTFVLLAPVILYSAPDAPPSLLSPSLNPQSLVLYLAVFLGFAIGGAGKVSLDSLFSRMNAGRKFGKYES